MITRRNFVHLFCTALCANALPASAGTNMRVLSTPGCGCCHAWADLARTRGYSVTIEDFTDPQAQKAALGIPQTLTSCHTVETSGYIFEGHVPLEALEAVLRDRPDITGLAVPGMPQGSPGMGNDPTARFDVIAFGGTAGAGMTYYRAGSKRPFSI